MVVCLGCLRKIDTRALLRQEYEVLDSRLRRLRVHTALALPSVCCIFIAWSMPVVSVGSSNKTPKCLGIMGTCTLTLSLSFLAKH